MSTRPPNFARRRGIYELVGGLVLIACGVLVTVLTRSLVRDHGGGVYLVMYGPMILGALGALRGIVRIVSGDDAADQLEPRLLEKRPRAAPTRLAPPPLRASPRRSAAEIAAGLGLVTLGVVLAARLYRGALLGEDGQYDLPPVSVLATVPYWLAVVAGLALLGLGVARAVSSLRHVDLAATFGYRTFVAWRYLLVFQTQVTVLARAATIVGALFLGLLIVASWTEVLHPVVALRLGLVAGAYLAVVMCWGILRYSKPSLILFLIGMASGIGSIIGTFVLGDNIPPPFSAEPDHITPILQFFSIAQLSGFAVAGLALFFGTLRAFFTFFTTVPIGGVWIGTAALVCVLSVMSGFETDLREKILGSNAHIQVTREDGEFVDWREAKAKLDRIPGVVASTPYAMSEVVIAANNNGMPVIIKGIDAVTVGNVTDLIAALEDPEALQRLEPLVEDEGSVGAPLEPVPQDGMDPPPDDLPAGGAPIDFSAPEGSADEPAAAGPDAAADARPDDSQLGTAPDAGAPLPPELTELLEADRQLAGDDAPVLDPPPADLAIADDEPTAYTAPDDGDDDEVAIEVIDDPFEPTLSRRTQSLPGVLVGRELVKQTHLYTGQEVRVVSPLSDPSNPDATGTPIPFNRDYRVAGVFYTGMYEYDLKYVYVTLESLQDFLDRGDAVDGIEVRIADADDTGRYVSSSDGPGLIRQALGPGYRVQDWRELNRSLFSALKLEKIAMFLVLGIVILVASFSIVGNLIMVVVEKAREIALLKTLGGSDIGVTHIFAIQGLIIGVIGTVLGVATGLAACWAGKKYGLPLNPDVYYIDRLPIHVDPESVIAAALAGVVISIAATLYPALLAARVRPAAGLRH